MTPSPKPPTPEKSALLLDFPIKLYTALRAVRLYPAATPQVQRCNDLVLRAFQALRAISPGNGSVTLAFSDGKVFVCGEQLPEKDQARLQVQGLISLSNRFNLYSFTFHPFFSATQCAAFIQTVSVLLGDKDLAEPVAALLEKAGITTVSADIQRYVAIREGEQVVQEEASNSELEVSDEELADLVLGKTNRKTISGVSSELVQELISRLPSAGTPYQHPEEVTKDVVEFLHELTRETDRHRQAAAIEQSAQALSELDPGLLARLIAALPPTPDADSVLRSALHRLTSRQMDTLIVNLVAQLAATGDNAPDRGDATDGNPLNRLARLEQEHTSEIQQTIARNIDARRLLHGPDILDEMPEQLLKRLRQPEWSASVLAAAAGHAVDATGKNGSTAELASFERTLAAYDDLFDRETQEQIAARAAADFSSFDEQELGLILVRTYKSLFGEQLYRQVIRQLPEDKLERLISHFQALCDSDDETNETSFELLQETVRREKRRVIVEMYQQQKLQREEQKQTSLKNRFDDLLQGNFTALEQVDLQQALPAEICELLADNREEAADALLAQLVAALHHERPAISAAACHTLAATGERLAIAGQWGRIERLLPDLQQGMRLEGIGEQTVQRGMAVIGGLAGHRLAEGNYAQAGEIIQILHRLTGQEIHAETEDHPVRSQALAALKHLCSRTVLEKLMQQYLRSESQQEAAGNLLVAMGTEAAKFQLQQLISNESRFERKRILALIKQTGNPALSILQAQLRKDQPWYVVRNVIRLLGEIGTPEVFATITPYIGHPDLRVQQEVIAAAGKIGGEDFKDFLLQALHVVDDSLKIKVVNQIATNHDERFVRLLTDLLTSARPIPVKNKNDLQRALCKALGQIGSRRATAALTRVAQSKNVLGMGGYADEVRQAAAMALEQIRTSSATRKRDETNNEVFNSAAAPARPAAAEEDAIPAQAREEAIFLLASQGDKEQAKQQLFDLIVATARAGDFKNAERLRERIYEIDNLALGEIIRSGEIIEEEKMGAIKEEDLEIWSDLTDRLTSQEFQTIYHELSELSFRPEETVVNQGDKNDALFFITQGSLKVSHQTGPRELFITTLNRGQIAGENFFAPSFWTVTLTSLTPTRLHVLKQSTLDAWKEHFPGLRAKLHAYYLACNTIGSMLEKKGLERRQDERFTLARKIQVQPVSNRDTPIGHGFRAETADISYGGLAFLVRISRQENARLLLGRRMQIVLPVGGKQQTLTFKGIIIGIQPFQVLENDFSVHFKFDHPLDRQKLQSILG
ncbi:HEAT repeat domain-containing protein [Desulfobulbus sp.]|uniref:HEAT repeat domain-containing protein n=1 Tax=Desulfobulbus sp. TaxID=895 RepID=UPI00286F9E9B|nr:HEAT repeat domain-containing protein [Desulfobulbus sp.]